MEITKCGDISGYTEGLPELCAVQNLKLNYDIAILSKTNRKDLCLSTQNRPVFYLNELIPDTDMHGKASTA